MTIKITILETFRFEAKEHPYSILGHWGCAFTACPMGQRVVPGQMAHKIESEGDVDLIHPNCLVEMQTELKRQSISFTIDDRTSSQKKA